MCRLWILLPLALASCFSDPPSAKTDTEESGDEVDSSGVAETGGSTTTTTTSGGTMLGTESSDAGTTLTRSSSSTDTSAEDSTGVPPPPSFCQRNGRAAEACEDFDIGAFGWAFEDNGYIFDLIPRGETPGNQAIRLTAELGDSTPPTRAWHQVNEVVAGERIQLSFDIRLPGENPHQTLCDGQDWYRAAEFAYLGPGGALTNLVFEVGPTTIRAFLSSPVRTTVVWQTGDLDTLDVWLSVDATLDLSEAPELIVALDGGGTQPVALPTFLPPDAGLSLNIGPWYDDNGTLPDGCYYDFDNLLVSLETD